MSLVSNGQSVSIIGQRRIGKTSLLYHVMDAPAGDETTRLRVYMDCGALMALDQHAIYRALLEDIADALETAGITDVALAPLQGDAVVTYRDFERALRHLFHHISQLVLVFDEFELLSRNANLKSDFFTGLRALAMRYAVTFITASQQPLLELTYANASTLSSPFFNIFATIRLGLFPSDVTKSLLNTLSAQSRVPFPPDLTDHLTMLSGGHPLFVQISGYHALDLLQNNHLTPETLKERFTESILPHLEYYWRSLSYEEQRTLLTLPMASRCDYQRDSIRTLEHACLIRRDDQNTLLYLSPVLHEFVLKQVVRGFVQAGPIMIDEEQHEVICYGQPIDITPTQYELLSAFVTHIGQVMTKEAIERLLWGETVVDDPERLKSVIKGLRRALRAYADHIENVRGIGYRWRSSL